jgi:glycine/D-amino acid oxidase-like deaminating enzyme
MRIPTLSTVDYDVVVVGARPAGAATALLLARQGLRVLVVDRGQYGTDTLSTHALMRAGVLQLLRFGVLPNALVGSRLPQPRRRARHGRGSPRLRARSRSTCRDHFRGDGSDRLLRVDPRGSAPASQTAGQGHVRRSHDHQHTDRGATTRSWRPLLMSASSRQSRYSKHGGSNCYERQHRNPAP